MIKVAVVDDHALVRKGIALFIKSLKGVEVLIEAENGQDLLKQIQETHVDIVLLDIQMPVMDGYEACQILVQNFPGVKVLIMSHLVNKESIHKALQAGAHGYFSKGGQPKQMETAIRTIQDKGIYFEPGLNALLHEALLWDKKSGYKGNPLSTLSEQEMRIIHLVCKGYDNAEIADHLSINIRTVETHRTRIIDKTEAKNFTSVILLAIKHDCIPIEDLLEKRSI